MIKPLIKWPGGKASEVVYIEPHIPKFDRYIEPFFGGGAMFFYLEPNRSIINDISSDLVNFYLFIKNENIKFRESMYGYANTWDSFNKTVQNEIDSLKDIYDKYQKNEIDNKKLAEITNTTIEKFIQKIGSLDNKIIVDFDGLKKELNRTLLDKIKRTKNNEIKNKQLLSSKDLGDNLVTGFMSGLYMHFRNIYNSVQKNIYKNIDLETKVANFYFIREYCYASMFRYNAKGEFNIPYGGISYNKKNYKRKIDLIFDKKIKNLLAETEIKQQDFQEVIENSSLNENDFMFLDPPYDTEFSDYEGKDFTSNDQKRLSEVLKKTKAKFILVIKNTDFIYSLYNNDYFKIKAFDKNYTYNVKSRNDRSVKHLLITNF